MRTQFLLRLSVLLFLAAGLSFAQAPKLFFTDLPSGPNTGGETVSGYAGSYVTLYGNDLGATQGASTVTLNGAACLRVVSWGATHFWYQRIVVQLGPSCTSGNFAVTTSSGTSNGLPFTVRTGNIYFVATTGNDSHNGSFATPWKTISQCAGSINPGDICYIMNGVADTTVGAYDAVIPIAEAGTSSMPYTIAAYPGATVTIGSGSVDFGVRVPLIDQDASWWVFSGMNLLGGIAMSVTTASNWRVVGNNFQCPTANGENGCFSTNEVTYVKFFGNEVTNTGVVNASKQQHAVYFSSDSNHIEAGWNYVHDNRSCRAIQFHSSPLGGGGSGDPTGYDQFDLSVHDNLIHDDPCDGIEFETIDPSQGKVEAYNNVIYHVGIGPAPGDGDSGDYSCIRVAGGTNNGPVGSGTVELYNNTLYDCGAYSASYGNNAAWFFDGWGYPTIAVRLRNNVTQLITGTPASENYFSNIANGLAGVSGSNNIWYGMGNGPSQTTGNTNANPLFVSTASHNFQVQSASPAIDAGVTINSGNVYNGYTAWNGSPLDFNGTPRPQGSAYDMGAYEYFNGVPSASGSAFSGKLATSGSVAIH